MSLQPLRQKSHQNKIGAEVGDGSTKRWRPSKARKEAQSTKYLEYKYAAKDILDNPNVPEEHRSNVLGQIWAKGERQGIDECLSFIEMKEAELILPSEIGDELRELVKRMTTKR